MEKIIKRRILFYEINLPSTINYISPIIELENKQYENNNKSIFFNINLRKFFEILPFINEELKHKNILFSADDENEKFKFNSLISYFINKEEIWKSIFFEKYIQYSYYFNQMKDIKSDFILAKLVDNNFLDNYIKLIFANSKNTFQEFSISDEIKNQINTFYKCIQVFQKKEELMKKYGLF